MQIDVNGARIFFDTVGSGLAIDGPRMAARPALIVMHGGPGFDHTTLRPYFDRFADTHQVVYIDHRGNGRSTGEISTWTLAQWGDDVKALCDALGIEKPVVYGNSFGGMVAMAYAARHPDHPAKLILSSTAARMHFEEMYRILGARGGPQAREVAERFWTDTTDASFAEYMAVCSPLYNPPGPAVAEQAMARGRALWRPEVTRHFALGEMRTMDARPGLAKIACPTLITAGTYDPVTPVVCSQEIMDALPPGLGRLEIFDGAGHGVHRDKPEEAERLLREFLAG